ncbi:unnamed protein product [Ilex paraguariensis]|uniref:Splicing factor 1 helix-hairpin domain-containing protein n=1 Tax=Ilex paraguariensis TaxID=185542 RepID=A0ABC8S3R3_9AQUA
MSTKIEQASAAIQTAVTATPSTSASKSGSEVVNEESAKQVQRKTKWGPDLTQDAAVRKGRALAYQTRVDQITRKLNSGKLEMAENLASPSASQMMDYESSGQHISNEESELLELERREAIGEILELNPSYKAPADYKPLFKESKVPIPTSLLCVDNSVWDMHLMTVQYCNCILKFSVFMNSVNDETSTYVLEPTGEAVSFAARVRNPNLNTQAAHTHRQYSGSKKAKTVITTATRRTTIITIMMLTFGNNELSHTPTNHTSTNTICRISSPTTTDINTSTSHGYWSNNDPMPWPWMH